MTTTNPVASPLRSVAMPSAAVGVSLLPPAPASFFAMVLGLSELTGAWREAETAWSLPPPVGNFLRIASTLAFIGWGTVYLNKWKAHRAEAKAEFNHPVQSSFVALIPESVVLMALLWKNELPLVALGLFWIGSVSNVAYGVYRFGQILTHPREAANNVPSLLLVYSASFLVNALAAGVFGYTEYGYALFGIGVIAWLVLDSVLLQQLMGGGLMARMRNMMGIYMAPPVVAFIAYQVLAGETAMPLLLYGLGGYALFITLTLLCAHRWLRQQPFAMGYWAYTFGIVGLAQGLIHFSAYHPSVFAHALALAGFALANLAVVWVAIKTVKLARTPQFFPALLTAPTR